MNLGKYRIEYRSNWPLLASLDTFRKAWTVSITDHVQLILVINRGTRIEYYANKFSTLIPIKPLGLIVHSLCFQGVNVFAIECISLPVGMLFPISSWTDWRAEVFFPITFLQFQYISCRLSHHTNLTIILFLTFFVSESLCTVKMSLTPMSKSMRDSTSCTNCLWLSWGTHGILTISRQLCLKYCCTSSIATSLPHL